MSDTPCIPVRFNFRRDGAVAYAGERVVSFEDARGKQPWEVEETRRETSVSRCPGFWKGLLMQEREDARQARSTLGLDKAAELAADPHRESSERLLEAWAPVENRLRDLVDHPVFAMWLAELHPHRLVGGVWYVGCRSRAQGWIQARFGYLIASCADRQVVLVPCNGKTREQVREYVLQWTPAESAA